MGRLSGNNEPGIATKRAHRVVNNECFIEGVLKFYLCNNIYVLFKQNFVAYLIRRPVEMPGISGRVNYFDTTCLFRVVIV